MRNHNMSIRNGALSQLAFPASAVDAIAAAASAGAAAADAAA